MNIQRTLPVKPRGGSEHGGDEGGINNPLILTEIQEVTSRYEGGGVIWDQRSTVSDSPSAPLFYFVAVEIIKLLQE